MGFSSHWVSERKSIDARGTRRKGWNEKANVSILLYWTRKKRAHERPHHEGFDDFHTVLQLSQPPLFPFLMYGRTRTDCPWNSRIGRRERRVASTPIPGRVKIHRMHLVYV